MTIATQVVISIRNFQKGAYFKGISRIYRNGMVYFKKITAYGGHTQKEPNVTVLPMVI